MKTNDDHDATPKLKGNMNKKVTQSARHVDDAETKFVRDLWIAISVDLVFHPKLLCLAIELGIDEAHALGVLVRMWLMSFKYAKDGDLWRGDEEATLRFVGVITGYRGDAKQLVETLRKNRWLEGWLVHDWLDYVGPFLIKSFKTSRRSWLVTTWAKYGRKYGAKYSPGEGLEEEDGEDGCLPESGTGSHADAEPDRNDSGSNQEVVGKHAGSRQEGNRNDKIKINPKPLYRSTHIRKIEPKTLSPPALGSKKREALNGGVGEIVGDDSAVDAMRRKNAVEPSNEKGFLFFVKQGGRAEGLNTPDFPLSLVAIDDVYAVYRNLLRFHGVLTTRLLREKITYCQATPATWMILLQDKVHAAYRPRDDGSMIDTSGADPVAMTIAALRPQNSGKRHFGTEASTNLFIDIMVDFAQTCGGQSSVWQSRLSGAAIAFELDRRKGRRGRAQTG